MPPALSGPPSTPTMPDNYFPKVRQARELLASKALDVLNQYQKIIMEAMASGDYETAAKHTQWLLEHMPAENGTRLIDPSAAKPKEVEGPKGPQIAIGIALGGMNKSLPSAEVIDVEPNGTSQDALPISGGPGDGRAESGLRRVAETAGVSPVGEA